MSGSRVFIRSLLLLCTFCAVPLTARLHRKKRSQKQAITVAQPPQKTIIIDLSGVLFKEDAGVVIKKVGFFRMARYAFWQDPADGFLNILEKMSHEKNQKPCAPLLFRGKTMPLCIIEWQQGKKTYTAVQKDIDAYLEKLDNDGYFSSSNEKIVMQSILNISFDPNQLFDITRPDTIMIKVVEQLKEKGYKLYALTNCARESFNILKTNYNELLKNFDGVGVSFEYQLVKPEKKIFEEFIKKHKLDPKHCLLIDNQPESIPVAKQLGMDAVLFTNAKECKNELNKRGIL